MSSLLCVAALLLGMDSAIACTRLRLNDDAVDLVRTVPSLDQPDAPIVGAGGTLTDTYRCPPGQTGFLINMQIPGLTYERDVALGGRMLAAYSMGPRSPLLAFWHTVQSTRNLSPSSAIGLRNGELNRNPGVVLATGSAMQHAVRMEVFDRGGAMESIPRTFLGTLEVWPEGDASQPFRHSFTVELSVPTVTCTLANASHTLDTVLASELAATGDTAKPSTFEMTMTCPMANVEVSLAVTDANQPGNAGSQLVPGPGSTAEGVQVQLLRGGQPLPLGKAWSQGPSASGVQGVPFEARYHRNADPLEPGIIIGQAVLTADYR